MDHVIHRILLMQDEQMVIPVTKTAFHAALNNAQLVVSKICPEQVDILTFEH